MRIDCTPTAPDNILELLADVNVWTVAAGLESLGDIIRDAYAFRALTEEGDTIGAYALRGQNLPGGVVVWLVAGQGGIPGADLTRDLLPVIEGQARGANFLAIQTTRPGLVKKLAAQGYAVGGTIMVKKLQ